LHQDKRQPFKIPVSGNWDAENRGAGFGRHHALYALSLLIERLSQKRVTVFRPEMRKNKEIRN